MLKFSFLLISFISLAIISLPSNIFSDFKERNINKFFIHNFIQLISSFVFILTFLQILSFKFFLVSNILKPLIYIIYTRSLLRTTIIILSYFITSSLLNIFINNNLEFNLLLTEQSNSNIYMFFCLIYIILNLLTFSNYFTSKLIFLYDKHPESLTVKVLLSLLLSARFNYVNKKYLFISALTGALSSIFITISAYNLSSNLIIINLLSILISAFIIYIINDFYFKEIIKVKRKSLIATVNIFISEFLKNTNQRVFIANYCHKKDKSLSMLTDIINLNQKKYKILGGGYSKNIVLLHPDKNCIYKIFGTEDNNAIDYYKYHLFEGLKDTFPEYDKKVFYYKQKKLNYVKVPFFKGKTAFDQLFYFGSSKHLNKNKINLILFSIFSKMKKLHSAKIDSEDRFGKNKNLTTKDLENYLELKFLKNIDQLLKNKFFYENNKNIFDIKNSLKNLSKEWQSCNKEIVFTHGDLSLSNIIISLNNEDCKVNFIDPNPSNLYLFPSAIIDISKLLQSSCVMWELATKTNDYLEFGIRNTKGVFRLPQPSNFYYAEKEIRKLASDLGFSKKIQDLHLLIHLRRILPYISKSKILSQYIIGYIYFILFEKY